MGNPLRDRRTPSELATSGQVIEINEELHNFTRLAGIVAADLGALDPDKLPADWQNARVTGRLSFGFVAAQGTLPALQGNVAVTIDAVCQRCLEPCRVPLAAELRFVFAAAEAVAAGEFEVWEFEQETLRPLDVVEEALIMALPLAALHVNDPSCPEPVVRAPEAGGKTRPFASLKAQMENDN